MTDSAVRPHPADPHAADPRPPSVRRRRLATAAVGAAVVALLGGGMAAAAPLAGTPVTSAVATSTGRVGTDGWVGTWSAAATVPATEGLGATGVSNGTLRQVAHVSVGGRQVRLHFSNVYGTTPLTLGAVTAASRTTGSGTPTVDGGVPVTFDGQPSVTIPVGVEWISDPVALRVPDDSDLVVSTYLPVATGPLTQHAAGFATGFLAPGDATVDTGGAYTAYGTVRYLLEGVDVLAPRVRSSVVLFGDSITDGVVTTVDANLRYPDQLSDRLLAGSPGRGLGVLNAGISGNRLLADAGTAGDSALSRFDRDVLAQTGVGTVVVLLGINDIGNSGGSLAPEQLIAVHRQMIRRAHDAGIRAVGATLTPYVGAGYATPEGEADRQALNEWIRTSGEYDAVVDFDAAVRDPAAPDRMLPAYDVGDHLHPNDAGMGAMAAALDLAVLTHP